MNKIVLDLNFLEALIFEKHEKHEDTDIILKVIKKDDYLYIPSHILVVMMNKLETYDDAEKTFFENILNNTRIGYTIRKKDYLEAFEMSKTTNLSYNDCLTVVYMKNNDIRNIISFNEEFSKVKGVRRLYRQDKHHPHRLNYFN